MATMRYVLLLVVFGVYFSVVNCGVEVKKCSGSNTLTEAIIGECEKPPCPLKRGTNVMFKVTFTPERDAAKVKSNVFGMLLGLKTPWPGLDGLDACTGMTPPCPVQKGKSYTWTADVEVKKSFPKVTVLMHIALKDESGSDLTCFDVPLKTT